MENNEVEKHELYDETNDDLITEEELENIPLDLDKNFPSPTMNSGIMAVHQNGPENIIDDPEDFFQYGRLILSGQKGNTLHQTNIKVTTAKLDGGSNSHVFTKIKIFAYIRPVQCNVKILNGIKAPAKSFGLTIIKTPKTNMIIPLWTSYYIP